MGKKRTLNLTESHQIPCTPPQTSPHHPPPSPLPHPPSQPPHTSPRHPLPPVPPIPPIPGHTPPGGAGAHLRLVLKANLVVEPQLEVRHA
ncbi:unnamed protein product [Closterium sp. NIES-53]